MIIPTSHLIPFSLASLAIIIVPGPSVLFTLARGIAWGRLVAVLTAVGNGLGILLLSALVAVGLGPLLAHSKLFTTVVEVAGGLYLLWLGADALRRRQAHAASLTNRESTKPPIRQVVRQGFVVGGFNPKALIFFVAVFPHFIDRTSGNLTVQLLVLGVIFTVLAVLSDGTWGMIAGTARSGWRGRPAGWWLCARSEASSCSARCPDHHVGLGLVTAPSLELGLPHGFVTVTKYAGPHEQAGQTAWRRTAARLGPGSGVRHSAYRGHRNNWACDRCYGRCVVARPARPALGPGSKRERGSHAEHQEGVAADNRSPTTQASWPGAGPDLAPIMVVM